MRFILSPEYHQQMLQHNDHPSDCYVRSDAYLHHMYVDGVKYVVVPALLDCLREAERRQDEEALRHLRLHKIQFDTLHDEAQKIGSLEGIVLLGDAPPDDEGTGPIRGAGYVPPSPRTINETGLSISFLFDMVLRAIYNRGRMSGLDLASELKLSFNVLAPILPAMRKQALIDIVGQQGGAGEAGYEYELKPPKGPLAADDALSKTTYSGPTPVPFEDYIEAMAAQTIRNFVVTRRTIERAFKDLVLSPEVFNEIGPAINSAASIFLFGFPGNGKTSIAERITRLMGEDIYIPFAVEANGQIIRLFDPIVHNMVQDDEPAEGLEGLLKQGTQHDERFVRIKRPTIIVGGELTLPMLDLRHNNVGKFYEAPLQMKANGGIFMIDDFGRQQVRPADLLNRWIVPLEKKYDYLTTVTGLKIEVPFDVLLILSTNIDPGQLADEAFLRRIKFKIEVRNPSEQQWRQVWQLVGNNRGVEIDQKGLDYMLEKWYRPHKRPFRMCQPRDILEQMICISKYNMERVTFSPDLIDAACSTYFIAAEKRDFGAKVRLD